MLDIRRIRQNPQELLDALQKRNSKIDLTEFLQKEEERRTLLSQVETLKARRNDESKRIAQIKREGGDAQPIMDEMRQLGDQVTALDAQIKQIEEYINDFVLRLPNYPSAMTPVGKDDSENVEQRRWGEPRHFEWEPKAHWDIGTDLNILDSTRRPRSAVRALPCIAAWARVLSARSSTSLWILMPPTATPRCCRPTWSPAAP